MFLFLSQTLQKQVQHSVLSVQEETHQRELSEQLNCATDAAARVDALQADVAATQEQVMELHSLNEVLAHDLLSKGQALEDCEVSLEDARSRCTTVSCAVTLSTLLLCAVMMLCTL